MRRLPEDDAWVVPHDLELAMFSPARINVLPFDPLHGVDTARQYASKYASKPEKHYFMDAVRDGVVHFLKATTIGVPMAMNGLLGFRVVRSTRKVDFTQTAFIPTDRTHNRRTDKDKELQPDYPDPNFHWGAVQRNYLFRNAALRHLRPEQFFRYFACAYRKTAGDQQPWAPASEDTVVSEGAASETSHPHYDAWAETVSTARILPGRNPISMAARRRGSHSFAVVRTPFFEPLPDKREDFYEQKLFLGLPWFCAGEGPQRSQDSLGKAVAKYRLEAWLPEAEDIPGEPLPPVRMDLALGHTVSFEEECKKLEAEFCKPAHGLVCPCCAGELQAALYGSPCASCKHAVGFHTCQNFPQQRWWRQGTLHNGLTKDLESSLYHLYKQKRLPLQVIREKAQSYVDAGELSESQAERVVRTVENDAGVCREPNFAAILAEDDARPEDTWLEYLRCCDAGLLCVTEIVESSKRARGSKILI